jgi:hypothetical protein
MNMAPARMHSVRDSLSKGEETMAENLSHDRPEEHESSQSGGHWDSGQTGMADIQKLLGGLEYPATKQDLIEHAQQNEASRRVIDLLEQLPSQMFNSPTDVSAAVGGGQQIGQSGNR